MFCVSCGQKNVEQARFCAGCGQAMAVPPAMPPANRPVQPTPMPPPAGRPTLPTSAGPPFAAPARHQPAPTNSGGQYDYSNTPPINNSQEATYPSSPHQMGFQPASVMQQLSPQEVQAKLAEYAKAYKQHSVNGIFFSSRQFGGMGRNEDAMKNILRQKVVQLGADLEAWESPLRMHKTLLRCLFFAVIVIGFLIYARR